MWSIVWHNIKNIDLNDMKIDEKSYKNVFICYIGYVMWNSVKPLDLIVNNATGYKEENNGNKYLTLDPTDKLEKYEEYGAKLKILLDQQIITLMIMMKKIWKFNSIQRLIYF